MDDVSYSAHISNGKSAINSKAKLSGVAKHNLRKYRSKEYDRENIALLFGSTNLLRDVKKVYKDTFTEALQQYNQKQTRADRRIDDYFEHVSEKNQDMAVEIIFQCGDKDFWEYIFSDTDKKKGNKENICKVYNALLEQLQKEMPDFKVANAVVHFDEASPHMHVVGVPIGRGFKRGLETKVSKRSVFTPKTLETVLQDSLRETANIQMLVYYDVFVKSKQKGKNHDLTVAEYKVQQETERLEKIEAGIDEKEDLLYDAFTRLTHTEKKAAEAENRLSGTQREIAGAEDALSQIRAEGRETKQKLMAEQEEIKQENQSLKTDTFILRSKKEILLSDVSKAENEKKQIQMKKEGLLEDISVLDREFEKRLDFINVLDKLKAILYKLLSMIPLVREFARLVEEKRNIKAATPYGYTPLGRLLKEYRTPLPRYERFVIFPEIASWQTSKGEVVPVYEDFNGRGTDYRPAGFRNVQTEQNIRVIDIKDEIIPENRICTLEQAEVYVKAVESFMEEMKPEETRYDRSVYRIDKEIDEWSR
ncbi:MAG: hypothetical protein HFG34_11750 [Eubacterium sp.]|nr:hypothetical protein [Eubacterium sp.]